MKKLRESLNMANIFGQPVKFIISSCQRALYIICHCNVTGIVNRQPGSKGNMYSLLQKRSSRSNNIETHNHQESRSFRSKLRELNPFSGLPNFSRIWSIICDARWIAIRFFNREFNRILSFVSKLISLSPLPLTEYILTEYILLNKISQGKDVVNHILVKRRKIK